MTKMSDISSVSDLMKDMYPRAGERVKQWVVDQRRESEWERATSPRVDVVDHEDNAESQCRNMGSVRWSYLDHDSCQTCNAIMHATRDRADIVAWLAEKANRPPIEQDRTKYSDEIAPDLALADHPIFAMFSK